MKPDPVTAQFIPINSTSERVVWVSPNNQYDLQYWLSYRSQWDTPSLWQVDPNTYVYSISLDPLILDPLPVWDLDGRYLTNIPSIFTAPCNCLHNDNIMLH